MTSSPKDDEVFVAPTIAAIKTLNLTEAEQRGKDLNDEVMLLNQERLEASFCSTA